MLPQSIHVLQNLAINGGAAHVPITLETYQSVGENHYNGSTQLFMSSDGAVKELSPEEIAMISTKAAHRQAIFDLSIFNLDRHPGNFLFKTSASHKPKLDIRPIDHGLSLPIYREKLPPIESLKKRIYDRQVKADKTFAETYKYELAQEVPTFTWITWPQVKTPLTPYDKHQISRMHNHFNISALYLSQLGIEEESIHLYFATLEMLLMASENDLTLYQVGKWVTQEEGPLGKIVIEAQSKATDKENKPFNFKIYEQEVKKGLIAAIPVISLL